MYELKKVMSGRQHLLLGGDFVMFFGMTNSPPTFQNMMNDVLKDVIDKGVVIVFIDNILIFMEDEEHHDEIVEEVLKKMIYF